MLWITPLIGLLVSLSLSASEPTKPSVAASIRPLELILTELAGDDFEIIRIAPPGSSPHHFEPSAGMRRRVADAKLVFYVSPHLDAWIGKLDGQRSVAVIQSLPPAQRIMALEHHHHDDNGSHHHHSDHKIVDPHFWMNPMTVKSTLGFIESELCTLKVTACPDIQKRRQAFETQLDELHEEISKQLGPYSGRSLITAHDFLAYFAKTYKLQYEEPVEPIPGKEPSPRDIVRLSRLVQERNLKVIYSEPQLSQQAVEAIAREANIRVAILDPIGVDSQIESYVDLIRFNTRSILEGFQE